MGYQVYERNGRDCGYGVPAVCDHPVCAAKIDRGLSYLCGREPGGGELGCGLYFCEKHRGWMRGFGGEVTLVCVRCASAQPPFSPKPDVREWVEWKLADESWADWRGKNPDAVAELSRTLSAPA